MKTPNFDPRDNMPRNLLPNSNLEFWQRGTSFVSLGDNQIYNADRLQWAGGTLTATLTGSRVAITGANSGIIPTRKIPWAIRYGVTVAQPSLAAGASAGPWIKVEGYNTLPLAEAGNAGFTFSFYTRAFRTGIYNVQFANGALTRNYVTTFTIAASDTWQRVVIFVPYLDVGNGVWDFTNGIGMYIRVWMASGTSGIGATPNVWQALGAAQIATGQVNAVQSTSDYLEMTGFMLHPEQEEKEFITMGRSYPEELALCQRYYNVTTARSTADPTNAAQKFTRCNWPVTMRAAPLCNSVGNFSQVNGGGGDFAVTALSGDITGFVRVVNVAGGLAGYQYVGTLTADAEL